jgi:hypothetical protein
VDAGYVPPTNLAPFAWAARATIAVTGGVAAALIASLLLRRSPGICGAMPVRSRRYAGGVCHSARRSRFLRRRVDRRGPRSSPVLGGHTCDSWSCTRSMR